MREDVAARSWFVWATQALGICAMVGVLLPWAHGSSWEASGVIRTSFGGNSYVQGVVVVAGAFGLVVVSALRMTRRISDVTYLLLGVAMCLLSLAASIWFWNSEIGVTDPAWKYEIFSGVLPRISAGNGWNATIVALLAAQLCLIAFAIDEMSIRVVRDDREFAGGSLLPERLRFRVVRRVHTTH